MFFKPPAHAQPTFQDGKSGKQVDVFLGSRDQKVLLDSNSFLSPRLALTRSHLFCRPRLIHAVTPFNRGQAVKDPITEVKHTFHVPSVDLRVWTTNFMWKCIEIGGEFMRGASGAEWSGVEWSGGEEGKVEGLGREGSVRMEGPESGVSERFKR